MADFLTLDSDDIEGGTEVVVDKAKIQLVADQGNKYLQMDSNQKVFLTTAGLATVKTALGIS